MHQAQLTYWSTEWYLKTMVGTRCIKRRQCL